LFYRVPALDLQYLEQRILAETQSLYML